MSLSPVNLFGDLLWFVLHTLSFMFKDEERGILVLELGFCLKRDFKHALVRYCLSQKYAVYGSQINPVPDFLAFPPN